MIANQEAHAGILEAGDKIVWSFRVVVGGEQGSHRGSLFVISYKQRSVGTKGIVVTEADFYFAM